MQEIAGIFGPEQLHHHGGCGLHIFHRVVAIGLFQPRFRPARNRQRRRGFGIEARRLEMTREHQALIEFESDDRIRSNSLRARPGRRRSAWCRRSRVSDCRAPRHYWRASRAASRARLRRARRRSRCPSRSSAAADSGSRPCGRSRTCIRHGRRRSSWRDNDTARPPPPAADGLGRAFRGPAESVPAAGGETPGTRIRRHRRVPRRVTTVRMSPVK